MRITFNMQANKYMGSIGNSLSAISEAQERVNLKRNLLNPEDNASAYIAAYSVQRMIDDLKQFTVNGKNASKWLTDADNALQEAMELISQAKNDYAVGGNSDSNNAESRAAMAEKVLEIYDTLMDIANSTSMGQYLFSGFATGTKPFQSGGNQVSAVTSLSRNGGEVSSKSVFSDLSELKSGKYTAKITVKNGIGTLTLIDDSGNKMILDSNGSDESGMKGNGSSNELTFEYKPGAVINTGRGISIKLPDSEESSVNLQFTYKAGSEMNYAGDMGSILAQIGYNQDVAINVPGGNIFTQSYKTLTGTKLNTVNGLAATLSSYFSQLDKANSNIGDSIKISGTDHMGNPVGAAKVLSPINPDLNLSNASEKERTLMVGYGDKMYKIVVPQGAYATADDLAAAINNQLKYAEYVDNINVPDAGYDDMDHYSSAVMNQIKNGAFEGELTEADRQKYSVDLSGEIKVGTDGDRLLFVTSKTGDNVRMTVSGLDQSMLGFKNMTAGGEGKDTTFEIGYEFHKEGVNQIKTTHSDMDLSEINYTFFINGTMISLNKPRTIITNNNLLDNQTFPTGAAGDPDYELIINGRQITVPAENFDGTDDTARTAINAAIEAAGMGAEVRVDTVNTLTGELEYSTASPSAKELELELDNAIKAAGLGFSFGASVTMATNQGLGVYDVSFTMNNNNINRDTLLNTSFYDTTVVPPSSSMESFTPNRFGVNVAKEHTLNDLAGFIKDLYEDSVSVTMEGGKLVIKDLRSGSSKLNVNINGLNQGISHPTDQSTVMGGKYVGAKDDEWQVKVISTLTNSDQRDVRVVIRDSSGTEIYNQLTENYLGGEIKLPYGVTITPNTMGIPDPADPTLTEKISEFDVTLTARGNVGFGDMNVTEDGKNVNIFRSLQNLANALKYNITKNGFSEPSAWKDESLSSTANPYFDGTFKGTFNDQWKFEIEQYNGKNDIFLQNEYTQSSGEIKYEQSLINKLGSEISFGVDLYDNVTGNSSRVAVNIDFSKAAPPVTDSASAQKYLLKELNSNEELIKQGARFVASDGKIVMQSGSGTKIATFANTATGGARALTASVMGFDAVSNGKLGEFPMTMAADAVINISDPGAADDPAASPEYPLRDITIPARTYDTQEDLLAAVNAELAKAEPDGTSGRITAVLDASGGIQFKNRDGSYVETTVDAGAANPLNIALETGPGRRADVFAPAAQKPKTDLSEAGEDARTLKCTYTEGIPPQEKTAIITLDKKSYGSTEEIALAINEKLAAQGITSADMKAVVGSGGTLAFAGSSGNIFNMTVQGDADATLGFTKAGDEAKIKITGSDGSLVQEVTLSTANQTVHVSDGLYLGFDKGTLKATDSFTGAVGSGIENEISVLDQAEKQILAAVTLVGNRGSRVESVAKFQETLTTSAENTKAQYLGSTDLDQIKAATDLQMAKTAYQSALAAASTILSISLLDFLN